VLNKKGIVVSKGRTKQLKPVSAFFTRSACVLVLAFFSHVTCGFSQQMFEVRHFAGSPGGVGTADGVGREARFQSPSAVWGDGTYLYVLDQFGRAIRQVTIATGEVRLIAGSLTSSGMVDGVGTLARFDGAAGLWGDGTYLYIADTGNGRIRRMTLATAEVITIAGTIRSNAMDGAASQAVFRAPVDIWGDGRFLYVADAGVLGFRSPSIPGTIRKIDLVRNTVSTIKLPLDSLGPLKLAGDGRELFMNLPQVYVMDLSTGAFRSLPNLFVSGSGFPRSIGGMWVGADGFLYLSDSSAQEILRLNLSTQEAQLLFGSTNKRDWIEGPGSQARLRDPAGIWGDGNRLYIADRNNHVIRAADLNTLQMTTLAGTGVRIADQAQNPSTPAGVSWSDGAYLYFSAQNQIWRMPMTGGASTVFAGNAAAGYMDGTPDRAQFDAIWAIWGDASFLYVMDGGGDRIRKISLRSGEVTTVVSAPGMHPFGGYAFGGIVGADIWGDGTYLFVTMNTAIARVTLATGAVETVAGTRNSVGSADGAGQNATFRGPTSLWGDANYLYIADRPNRNIRRMSLRTYEVTTIAGRAEPGDIADGIGLDAVFFLPTGVWGDGANLYIADGSAVRKLTIATNEVRTIAGSRLTGISDGIGAQARFSLAWNVWGAGGMLYVEDTGRVRVVNPANGAVETIAGRPTIAADGVGMDARFNSPAGIWGDANYLYVTDRSNHVLRRINRRTREVKTVAGFAGEAGVADGLGDKARFNNPTAICGDGIAIYVADTGNHTIRKVTIGTWQVDTVAGSPGAIGGPPTLLYYSPSALWCEKTQLYIQDSFAIRKIAYATGEVTVLVSGGLNVTISPFWSDGRFLYFSSRSGLKKLDLSTLAVTDVNSFQPSGYDLWVTGQNVYIPAGFSVRLYDGATGDLSSIAGSDPIPGTEDGVGAAARFQGASGVWGDGRMLYVTDTSNHAIRTITLAPATITASLPFAVAPPGSVSRITQQADAPIQTGYARIKADANSTAPSGIAVYGFRSNGVLVSETGVPAVAPVRSGRLYAETTATVRTGLAIANPNSQGVSISYYFTDASGQNFGNGSFVLNANRQIAAFLDEQPFAGSTSSQRPLAEARTFTFLATQPVAAIALRGFVNERGDFLMTTLPIADPSRSTSNVAVVPHFAAGGGWATQIALVNPSDGSMAGTLQFFDQNGALLESQSYAISPRSAVVNRKTSNEPLIRVGSIHLVPNAGQQTPVGLSVFSFTVSGVTVTETGVPTMPPASTLMIYGENSASLRSGFAFANAAARAVTVAYDLLSSDGATVAMNGSLDIPANGQRALFLNEMPGAQALPENFKGVLRITASSGGSISAIGLRGRTNERGEFLVSTTMPDQNAAESNTELIVPHFVQGGGYTTEFILIGRGTSSASHNGSIDFYSQAGEALPLTIQ
jgi:sugar lactone lactonase YvrE